MFLDHLDGQIPCLINRNTDGHVDGWTARWTYRQTNRQTLRNKQTKRRNDRRTDRMSRQKQAVTKSIHTDKIKCHSVLLTMGKLIAESLI